jgi:hypothetical protein
MIENKSAETKRRFRSCAKKKRSNTPGQTMLKTLLISTCLTMHKGLKLLSSMSTTETISLPRNLPKRKVVSQAVATDYAFIKKLIWAYFLLLLFEGALRKWFLPGLSQGLLIIRDPIVIWIYYLCYAQGLSS